MSRYASRSMDRLTASEPGQTIQAARPEVKRSSSTPVTSLSVGTFLQVPDSTTANAYKARVTKKPKDSLMNTCTYPLLHLLL